MKSKVKLKKRYVEEALLRRTHDLGERVKELRCLYGISRFLADADKPLNEILQGVVRSIPPAWQYPDITCARITFEGRQFKTKNFNETAWKQSSDIRIFGKKAGAVEVYYLQKKPAAHEGPFLKEERDLIGALAGEIGKFVKHKKADEKLQASEQKYKELTETTTDWSWEVDKNGAYVYVSPLVKELLGYKVGEVLGKTPFDFMPREEAKRVTAIFKKKLINKEPFYKLQNINRHKDGHLVVLESNGIPVFDEKGRLKGYRGIDRDITDRKQAEEKLAALNAELARSNKKLRELTVKDSHTGLYSHRYLEGAIKSEFNRAERYGHPLSLIMLDIDYFKSINDVYGHLFGDLVLKQFANRLKKMVRESDIAIRFGGEEFIIIAPVTDRAGGLVLAYRIFDNVNLRRFGNGKHPVKLKLSIAVSSYPEDDAARAMDLIEIADRILGKAKEFGGNRICSSPDLKKEKNGFLKKTKESAEIGVLKEKIDRLAKRASQGLIEAVFAFAKTIELKDDYTGKHTEKTVRIAEKIAEAFLLPKDEIERIRKGATLHDLGKVGISEKILRKKSRLTRRECEEIKKHPQIGVDIIRPIQSLRDVIPLVLHHHERWDGKGYPHGLKGKVIPIGARIISIADAYQALTSRRPYRKAYSKDAAIKIIKTESGVKFDPDIVDVFLGLLKKGK